MYIRVKRQKTTIFLLTDQKEAVVEVKAKLQKLLDGKDPIDMRLVLVRGSLELEDARTLAELKVQNDDVVALCYRKDTEGGEEWEDVDIAEVPQ